jgi:hypothetical protein
MPQDTMLPSVKDFWQTDYIRLSDIYKVRLLQVLQRAYRAYQKSGISEQIQAILC